MKNLVAPCINLNGSDATDLLRGYLEIDKAFDNLASLICNAMPHGRDYQNSPVDGENGVYKARDAFIKRVDTLHQMRKEFHAVALKIAEQIK